MKKKIYVAPRVLRVINNALCYDNTETPSGSVYHGSAKETTFDFDEDEEDEYTDPWS